MKVRKVYPSMKFVKVALYTVPIWIAVYVIILGMLYSNQRSMLYSPPKVSEEQIATGALKKYQSIYATTSDGLKLRGFFHAPADQSKPVILAFHGNASHPLWMAHDFNDMVETGYGVLLAEYRGYGGNQGHPTEEGIYLDAEAFFQSEELKKIRTTNPLVIYGQSLGSAAAVDLAQRHNEEISALILEVPFDNLTSVVEKNFPIVFGVRFLLEDKYESDKKIMDIMPPKLFLLAEKDEVVGFDSGKKLFEIARQPKQIIEYKNATHNGLSMFGASKDTQNFIESLSHEK